MNQYEWIIATPRSNSACTFGSQEVGKLSLPSFSSCWPKALPLSAAVIPATSIKHVGFMGTSGRVRSLMTAAVGCSKHRFREAAIKGQEFGAFHWQFSAYYTGDSHVWRGLLNAHLV